MMQVQDSQANGFEVAVGEVLKNGIKTKLVSIIMWGGVGEQRSSYIIAHGSMVCSDFPKS